MDRILALEALRKQVTEQNREINEYRAFLRRLRRYTPHKWLKDDIDVLLKENE